MIIIKSQDGRFIGECRNVQYNKTTEGESHIFANLVVRPDHMGGVDETYDTLGYYATEERAKEVMGEINKHIEKMIWLKLHGNNATVMEEQGYYNEDDKNNILIYPMPEE